MIIEISPFPPSPEVLETENEILRHRLDEAEQTLNAIRQGSIDALVIGGPEGDNVFTLAGADHNYRLLIESIGEGALTATLDGSILYCNSKFAEMVNRATETIVGRNIAEFIIAHQRSGFESFLHAAATSANKQEVTLIAHGGIQLSTQVSIGPLDADHLNGISIIVTDLTQTKMAASLAKSNAELEEYAFVASHDLKEPLRTVTTYVQLLERSFRGKLAEDAELNMKFITDATKRMSNLIDDLLEYSRAGQKNEPLVVCDCNSILQTVISNLRQTIEENQAEIHIDSMHFAMGEPMQLTQLFQNLLSNALKYRSKDSPRIQIMSKPLGTEICFSVQDNGIGIESRFFEKIFALFQRLHGREEYSGTGIGLAICKRIVLRHGGRIWVESTPKQGSTFHFTLRPVPPSAPEGTLYV